MFSACRDARYMSVNCSVQHASMKEVTGQVSGQLAHLATRAVKRRIKREGASVLFLEELKEFLMREAGTRVVRL